LQVDYGSNPTKEQEVGGLHQPWTGPYYLAAKSCIRLGFRLWKVKLGPKWFVIMQRRCDWLVFVGYLVLRSGKWDIHLEMARFWT